MLYERNMFIVRYCKVAVCICLTVSACHEVIAGVVLNIKSEQSVNGPVVLLADVVSNASILPEGWSERKVMSAPSSGGPVVHPLETIAYALQKYPDMQDVTLSGRPSFTVERKGVDYAEEKIYKAVKSFVDLNDMWNSGPVDVQCDALKEEVIIPAGEVSILVGEYEAEKEAYTYTFQVSIIVDGVEEQTLTVKTLIRPLVEIWTARSSLARGEKLTLDMLGRKTITADSNDRYISVDEIVEGLEVVRPIQGGRPLSWSYLAQPVCVERGERLKVNIERGGLAVNLRAKALSDGRKGEKIYCMNESSMRRLMVRVTGPREAVIDM